MTSNISRIAHEAKIEIPVLVKEQKEPQVPLSKPSKNKVTAPKEEESLLSKRKNLLLYSQRKNLLQYSQVKNLVLYSQRKNLLQYSISEPKLPKRNRPKLKR
ncbi:Hypothetical protein FKW44_015254 [Caligus rogercresseyi]|uniref:Uncharacterized protein n=1 Tax=Caligus rogercresseyi TaxID=217165 RepID=A0A7T8H018_CALRO|nr:Hypothetical protein FKW44_015254 [Caligus rogercresseyi]